MSTPTLDMSGTYSFHLCSSVSARNTDCTTKRETLLGDAFIFYCCVAIYHKFHVLKQYPFTILPFLWVRSPGMDLLTSLPRVSLGWNQVSVKLPSHLESQLRMDQLWSFLGFLAKFIGHRFMAAAPSSWQQSRDLLTLRKIWILLKRLFWLIHAHPG